MAAIANMILADGQNSPVNRTFEVVTSQQGSDTPAQWAERSSGAYASYKQLTLSVRRSTKNEASKVDLRITIPVVDTITGVVKYRIPAYITFTLPDASTLQERKDITAFTRNALAQSIVIDAINNNSPAY